MNGPFIAKFRRFLPGVFCLALLQTTYAANLWDGEEVRMGAGFPFIAKFIAADRDAPLVVFIPGARSLARIAYGGHEGGLNEDFLAYWLNREGYNFLGISYPVLTDDGAFDEAHPDMTVRAWGYGSAEVTKAVMEERGLTGPVIVAVWSMGGKSVRAGCSRFAASEGKRPSGDHSRRNPELALHRPLARAADRDRASDGQLHSTPLGRHAGHQVLRADYPLVAMIVPGQDDPRHAVMDRATWGHQLQYPVLRLRGR